MLWVGLGAVQDPPADAGAERPVSPGGGRSGIRQTPGPLPAHADRPVPPGTGGWGGGEG